MLIERVKKKVCTVKLGFKELLDKEQIGVSEPFPVTNLPFDLTNSEQIGISEQFCDDQKVPLMPSLTLPIYCLLLA